MRSRQPEAVSDHDWLFRIPKVDVAISKREPTVALCEYSRKIWATVWRCLGGADWSVCRISSMAGRNAPSFGAPTGLVRVSDAPIRVLKFEPIVTRTAYILRKALSGRTSVAARRLDVSPIVSQWLKKNPLIDRLNDRTPDHNMTYGRGFMGSDWKLPEAVSIRTAGSSS